MRDASSAVRSRGALAHRAYVGGCTFLLLDLLALPSYADDYATRFDPRIEVGGLYDDNYRLTPGSTGNVEVAGFVLDAELAARFTSPTSEIKLTPRVRSRYFPGDSDEDDTSEFVTVDYRSESETTRFGGIAQCSRQAVMISERPAPDIGVPPLGNAPGVDTGFANSRSTQQLCQLGPRFAFDVTNTSRIELSAQYLDVDYSRERFNTPTGFDSLGGAVEFANDLSAISTLRTRLVASRFEPDSTDDPKSDSYGAQFEWQRRASETFESYLRLGIERVATDDSAGAGDSSLNSSNYVFGAGIRRDYQITKVFLDLSRSVAPSSSGQLITRNQVKARLKRDFSPTVAGIASVLGIDDSAAEADLGFRDRRYVVGILGLEWRLTRRFSLLGEYGYTRQKYENDSDAAKANRVSLSIVYEPNRLSP